MREATVLPLREAPGYAREVAIRRTSVLDDVMAQSYEQLLLSILNNLQTGVDSLRKEFRDEAQQTRRAVVDGDTTLRSEISAVDTRLTGRMDALESDQEAMSLTLAAQRARASTYGAIAAAGVSIVAAPLFAILVDVIRK